MPRLTVHLCEITIDLPPLYFYCGLWFEGEQVVLEAMLDLIYEGEAELEEELKDSFVKLLIDIELCGVTKKTLVKHNN